MSYNTIYKHALELTTPIAENLNISKLWATLNEELYDRDDRIILDRCNGRIASYSESKKYGCPCIRFQTNISYHGTPFYEDSREPIKLTKEECQRLSFLEDFLDNLYYKFLLKDAL